MAVSGQGLNFQWFRYTDDGGAHWSMRVDNAWGTAGANGFAAFNAADPVFGRDDRFRRRRAVIAQDLASTRVTRMPVGSKTATVYAKGQTFTRYVRGLEDAVTFTVIKLVGEKLGGPKAITSLPEYSEPL